MTIDQLIHQLSAEGLVAPDQRPALAALLAQQEPTEHQQMPWYLRGLVGIGAWIAALLLVAFCSTIAAIGSGDGFLLLGLISCAGAVGLYRLAPRTIFVDQLSIALSLAGQVQVAIGLGTLSNDTSWVFIGLIVLEAVLIVVHPDAVVRFFAVLAIVAALVGLFWTWELYEATNLLIIALGAGATVLWNREAFWITKRRESLARPIGYGMVCALFALLIGSFINTGGDGVRLWWISTSGLLIILLGQIWYVLRHQGMTGREPLALALLVGAALTSVPALHTPGLVAALLIAIVGVQRGNPLLTGLAASFFALFLGEFYYHLDVTLLTKSLVLLGTGGVLLLLRTVVLRLVRWPEETV